MKVLITGIASALGQLLTAELLADGHEVMGIDRRFWADAPAGVKIFHVDVRKRPAEEVFRTERPEAVIHMATVTPFSASPQERYRINLGGTRVVFEHCETYGVKKAIFVGRHTFYGADAESPLYHTEEEPPMAVSTFPELADLVAADLFAGSALWRSPQIDTVVLRICYALGDAGQGTLASYLRGPRVPTVLGFDPLYQFIHDRDMARAIALALKTRMRGIFNVAGPQPVPLSLLIKATGRKQLALPEPLFQSAMGRFGLPKLPPGSLNHVKYPIVIDGSRFAEATGFAPRYDEVQTMDSFMWARF